MEIEYDQSQDEIKKSWLGCINAIGEFSACTNYCTLSL